MWYKYINLHCCYYWLSMIYVLCVEFELRERSCDISVFRGSQSLLIWKIDQVIAFFMMFSFEMTRKVAFNSSTTVRSWRAHRPFSRSYIEFREPSFRLRYTDTCWWVIVINLLRLNILHSARGDICHFLSFSSLQLLRTLLHYHTILYSAVFQVTCAFPAGAPLLDFKISNLLETKIYPMNNWHLLLTMINWKRNRLFVSQYHMYVHYNI